MNKTIRKHSILLGSLLGVLVAGQAAAATLRYQNSGDYFATVAVTGSYGWQDGGGGPGGVPGAADTIRCNWGNNTVTLSGVAPLINNFQLGVDESGQLVVDAGGLLQATGGSTVGNNNVCTGQLFVNTGGEVDVTNWMMVGAGSSTTGILTINGGTVRTTSHLWVGSASAAVGAIYITNGGSLNVGGNIGLGTVNANTPSGGKGSLFVQDGGTLNLSQISSVNSIQPNSVLDISGSGVVLIPNNQSNVISAYVTASRITAYGGLGMVGIDYNNTNVGMTTIYAIAPLAPPPTDVTWNPTANPSGTGKWNENANWTGGVRPANVTTVNFNIVGAIPCTVTNAALADSVIQGKNGPGGTLTIANGGSLAPASVVNASIIGNNSNALMVVENGASVSFGYQLLIGSDPGSDGKLIMNGGTVSVADMFALGSNGGKGTAQINGGTLSLSQWDVFPSIQGDSVLDVSGTGEVVINGNQQASVNNYILTGQITNHTGTPLIADFNNIVAGKTTIYSSDVYLPPANATWNPALNSPDDTIGFWNVSSNWAGGILPGNGTFVRFNVPGAIPCILTNAVTISSQKLGLDGPAGTSSTLIITNGGSLTANNPDEWNSIAMNNTSIGVLVVDGGSVSYANHIWIGFDPGTDGTLILNNGTVTVGQQFGLGWNGGTGHANINGGTLHLAQMDSVNSISGTSVLNVAGTGKVVLNGNQFNTISNYVSLGRITANGGPNVFYFYDSGADKTTVSAVLLPPPPQSVTAVSVSGGKVTLTYQTTFQHTYHIESAPRLSPPSWTPVAGSTNAATGAPVTFTFPAGSGQMFYRTVSP